MNKKRILVALVLATTVTATAAAASGCSASSATVESTYVYGKVNSNAYGGVTSDAYQVIFYDDGTYEYINTTVIYGYSMNLGTTTIVNMGTYAVGSSVDGYTSYTLSDAEHVLFNSYSLAGGYNISIDTNTATYPVELLASGEGEKVYANSTEEIVAAYGSGITIYVSDSSNLFYLTDPNA